MSDPKTDPEAPTPVEGPRIVVTGTGPNLCYGVSVEADGFIYMPEGNKPLALCACGLSNTKPFCDGSHKALNDHDITESQDIK